MCKKLKKNNIKFIFGLILFIMLNFISIHSFLTHLNNDDIEFNNMKSSGIYYDVVIDDLPSSSTNWAWAAAQTWFGSGSGTSGDPYIIENHIFEYSVGSGFCFSIINSKKHFIINNCTFRNSNLGNVGLLLTNVTNGQIFNSSIYNSLGDGIWIEDTNGILISNNEIYDNTYSGIYITGTSENNIITGNIFDNNGWYGVEIDSSYNLFYSNYFINPNTDHAYDGSFFNNDWNNSVIGNYWDDYGGYDMDLDGIGDTPYDVPPGGGSQDYLPIWNIQAPIAIDDLPSSPTNWAWAVTQAWCSGSGSSGDPYVIKDLIIDGEGTNNCIFVENSNKNFIIQNCKIYNSGGAMFESGILLVNVTNSQIIGNNASNNQFMGITLINCNDNTISDNTINSNHQYGIYLDNSYFNTLSENTAFNNPASNIYLLNSGNNTLYRNKADEISDYGIFLENSEFNDIIECEAFNSTECGIYLLGSHNNSIIDSIANFNHYGIYADGSSENVISGNSANNNTLFGLEVYSSYNNSLINNFAQYNIGMYGGIIVADSDDTLVEGNQVFDNNPAGIYFWGHGDNSIVRGNVIKDNINGIYLEALSDGNLFYENYFVGNDYHVEGLGINNDWNCSLIGNYWDNYTGPDLDHNGIGDIPHNITLSPLRQDFLPIVDNQPPTIIINSPSIDDIFGATPPDFNLTIIDDYLFEMWYTMDGGLHNYTFTGFTGIIDQFAWDSIADGLIILQFYANDKSGNIGYAEVSIEKDSQAPIIVINSPNAGDTFGTSAPSFIIEISDPNLDSMWYSLDGGLTNFTFTADDTINQAAWTALPEGSVTITFYANDTLGNIASESVNIEKDLPASGDDFIIIIIVISIVSGAAIVTIVLVVVLRKRKVGEQVPGEEILGEEIPGEEI